VVTEGSQQNKTCLKFQPKPSQFQPPFIRLTFVPTLPEHRYNTAKSPFVSLAKPPSAV
jgi:hypothetical protein